MMKNKAPFLFKSLALVLPFLLSTSCIQNRTIDRQDSNPPVQSGDGLREVYHSPAELAAWIDLVVIGYVIEPREVINLSLLPEVFLDVGQVYQFKVEEYLKGTGEEVIFVIKQEGSVEREGVGIDFTEADVLEAKESSTTPPLEPGKPYLLFLYSSRSEEHNFPQNYFFSHSFKFDVSNPDNIVPEVSSIADWSMMKYPKTLEELKKHIIDPINFPYPDPGYMPAPFQEEPLLPVPAPQDPPGPYPDPESAAGANQNEVLAYPPP